jgi:uncharacterized repeat protein (TIGR02543 family)
MRKFSLAAFISIVIGTGIGSCDKDTPANEIFRTVTFDACGGAPVPPVQSVRDGETASAPATSPAKEGYVFLFWSLGEATTAYDFSMPVVGDITLSARWEAEPKVEYWQVTWHLNGGSWPANDNHATQAAKGGTLAEPAAPLKTGTAFDGWYSDAALTNRVSFPRDLSAATSDIALYAKWKGEEPSTFSIRGTSEWLAAVNAVKAGGNNKSYTFAIEGNVSVPPTTGVKQGDLSTYTFGKTEKIVVTLAGSGTLALSGQGFLIAMAGTPSAKSRLIIDGPALLGRSDNTVSLLRFDEANLELRSGKITGNVNNGGGGAGSGGGVNIRRGSFTMSGGELSNNTCGQGGYAADGGGASVDGGCIVSGGTISGNTANSGGGINASHMTMTGGVIKGNTARNSSPFGGGVKIDAYGTFSKTGGIIYGYSAGDANSNKTVFYDGKISTDYGAAVYFTVSWGSSKRRETTLGATDNLLGTEDAGWISK